MLWPLAVSTVEELFRFHFTFQIIGNIYECGGRGAEVLDERNCMPRALVITSSVNLYSMPTTFTGETLVRLKFSLKTCG